MKYSEVEFFMADYINPDGSLDWEGIEFQLNDTLQMNVDKLTSNIPTHYFADELIYSNFRDTAEFLKTAYPSKKQIVKWFKEKNLYHNVLNMVERARK